MKTKKNRAQLDREMREIVSKIEIHPRVTPQGRAQREAFRRRWGFRPEAL
jgi:hypothetical protein